MSRRCQVTGAQPSFGRSVSHPHRRNDPDRLIVGGYDPVRPAARRVPGGALMARTGTRVRNEQRRVVVERPRVRRAELPGVRKASW